MSYYSVIAALFDKPYDQMQGFINDLFRDEMFESFVAQKGLEKIYRMPLNKTKKEALIVQISCAFNKHREETILIYDFIKTFFPIADELFAQIKGLIKCTFDDSLSLFYYYLGQLVFDNPLTIGTAKWILVSAATTVLKNDLPCISNSLSMTIATSARKTEMLQKCYLLAIKLGVLREKYDAICFGREKIEDIVCNQKPVLFLKLKNQDFEYGLQYGSAYHSYVSNAKREESPGIIQQFYKCYICKYCRIKCIDEDAKELAFSLLDRQFAARNMTDLFFYYTGDVPSYLFSIVSYLYAHMLILILCSQNTMELVTYGTVRKKMLWGERITDSEYDLLIKRLRASSTFQNWIQSNEEGFIIGRWQFDYDIFVSEIVNKIALDSKADSKFGKISDCFGKNTYESIVRGIAKQSGWNVVPHSIHKKENARSTTDVDLIAYKAGVVLIGQIKVANCGRTPYEIWKGKQVLDRAINQSRLSMDILKKDIQLLFSILKKYNIVSSKSEIKTLVPIIITRSSYYIGMGHDSGIPIISLDMFQQIMNYLSNISDAEIIVSCISKPFELFDLPVHNNITESHIEQEEFSIFYEEILDEDA